MSNLQAAVADEINVQHRLAVQHAGGAIEHAKRAGKLLTQVKAGLPHGAFLPWVSAQVEVSPRQAQRYMAAAQGRALTLRSIKDDTASHLPRRAAAFEPVPDCWMHTRQGGHTYFVEQSLDHGYFYCCAIALIGEDDVVMEYVKRPLRADYVEFLLRVWGLAEPAEAAWRIGRGCRVASALGAQQ